MERPDPPILTIGPTPRLGTMAARLELHYASPLGHHRHYLWLDPDAPHRPPSLPDPIAGQPQILPIHAFGLDRPRLGRFYPAKVLHGVRTAGPVFRVVEVTAETFTVDFSHPLANQTVQWLIGDETSLEGNSRGLGRPLDLLPWAGLEQPLAGKTIDFAELGSWQRLDDHPDGIFYATPRRLLHLDEVCSSRVQALYQALVPSDGKILDLMAGWRSHLSHPSVIGLGMNEVELADNPQLQGWQVQDLNENPHLPFADGYFTAVVCTASLEYLLQPLAVLAEVRRVLVPGGTLAVTFSDRWFPPKVIGLWTKLHPMERLSWVLHLLATSGFRHLHSQLERGLARPPGDRYSSQRLEMDPLWAAWGQV